MSSKKPIIDRSRFSGLKNLSQNNIQTEKEITKTRFEQDEDSISVVEINLDDLQDAPTLWNFYRPLPEDKFCELIDSIEGNGLLHPIVVWEQQDGYMILAGHNRVRAYRALRDITGDDIYSKIPSVVKKKDQITEQKAQEIIIDTNWVTRQLTSYEKTNSIIKKYVNLKQDGSIKGKTRDIIGKNLGITGRMVQNYLSLRKLQPQFFDMIDDKRIKLTDAIEVSKLPADLQDYIYEKSKSETLDSKFYKNIKKVNSKKEIDDLVHEMDLGQNRMVSLTLEVPKDKKDEFLKIYQSYMKELKNKSTLR